MSESKENIKEKAYKSLRLSTLLLGESVSEEDLEDQGRDFMNLSEEDIDSSLKRALFWNDCEKYDYSLFNRKREEDTEEDRDGEDIKEEDVTKKTSAGVRLLELGASLLEESSLPEEDLENLGTVVKKLKSNCKYEE